MEDGKVKIKNGRDVYDLNLEKYGVWNSKKQKVISNDGKELSIVEIIRRKKPPKDLELGTSGIPSLTKTIDYITKEATDDNFVGRAVMPLIPQLFRFYSGRGRATPKFELIKKRFPRTGLTGAKEKEFKSEVRKLLDLMYSAFPLPNKMMVTLAKNPEDFINQGIKDAGLHENGNPYFMGDTIDESDGQLRDKWIEKTSKKPTPFSMLINGIGDIYEKMFLKLEGDETPRKEQAQAVVKKKTADGKDVLVEKPAKTGALVYDEEEEVIGSWNKETKKVKEFNFKKALDFYAKQMGVGGEIGSVVMALTPEFSKYGNISGYQILPKFKKIQEKLKKSNPAQLKQKIKTALSNVISVFGNPENSPLEYRDFIDFPSVFIRDSLHDEGLLGNSNSVQSVIFEVEQTRGKLRDDWISTFRGETPFGMLVTEFKDIYNQL